MIGDAFDTFRNVIQTVNHQFVRKSHKSEGLKFEKLICQSGLLGLRHFAAQCSRSLICRQRQKEQIPAKKRSFLTVYTR